MYQVIQLTCCGEPIEEVILETNDKSRAVMSASYMENIYKEKAKVVEVEKGE